MEIGRLRSCIRTNKYEISLHAQKERYAEQIRLREIEQAIIKGEIIERYPEDPRGHSCLVLGYAGTQPIHIVCSILSNGWLRIITVYIPKMPKWISPRERRR